MTQVSFPALRMRRLRRTPLIRELVREVRLDRSNLIQPIFVEEGLKTEVGILSMPGQRRQSPGTVGREVGRLVDKGVKSVILFGIPTVKDEIGSAAYDPNGIVQTIRQALDDSGFKDVAVMAYAAKHASSFFGPFRDAASSTPKFGDRRTYQMDYSNPEQALREIALDIKEGADMIMIKPALAYLDIVYRAKKRFQMPTAAYNVSGEFSMIKAAAREGWIDEKSAILEVLTSIKRAGADIILTYHAVEAAEWLG